MTTDRRASVEAAFGVLQEAVTATHPGADLVQLRRIFEIAERCHRGQWRKSGDPYVLHPLTVATYIAQWGQPIASVHAALLHDVPETRWALRDVADQVGADVIDLVEALWTLEQRRAGDPAVMLTIEDPDARRFAEQVLTLKIADRLHNARTWRFVPPAKARRKARETIEVIAPIAGVLGLSAIEAELHEVSTEALAGNDSSSEPADTAGWASAQDPRSGFARLADVATRRAVRLVPAADRERYAAEWEADLATIAPARARLAFALGLQYSARALRRQAHARPSRVPGL